jgi:hypothetical protein
MVFLFPQAILAVRKPAISMFSRFSKRWGMETGSSMINEGELY